MKKLIIFLILFDTFLYGMQQLNEPHEIRLPALIQITSEYELPLSGTETDDYRYLTFDKDDSFFNPNNNDTSIIALTLHKYKPTGNVAFGRAASRDTFELCGECDKAITGFDMHPNWPDEKAFIVCRQEGFCTLFDLKECGYVTHWITNEHLTGVYFESGKTAICLTENEIFRWDFTTGAVTRLGPFKGIPFPAHNQITIRKELLQEELLKEAETAQEEQHTHPKKTVFGCLKELLFG